MARAGWSGNQEPNREHTLSISVSKHLYLTKAGALRWQQKDLDPRLAGTKTLLTRLLIQDVSTGVFYAELHEPDDADDLLGFLGRAWVRKQFHPMHGVPGKLNLPAIANTHEPYVTDLHALQVVVKLDFGDASYGYQGVSRAAGTFDRRVSYLPERGSDLLIETVQRLSSIVSAQACRAAHSESHQAWATIKPMPNSLTDFLDGIYQEHAGWRTGRWEDVVEVSTP